MTNFRAGLYHGQSKVDDARGAWDTKIKGEIPHWLKDLRIYPSKKRQTTRLNQRFNQEDMRGKYSYRMEIYQEVYVTFAKNMGMFVGLLVINLSDGVGFFRLVMSSLAPTERIRWESKSGTVFHWSIYHYVALLMADISWIDISLIYGSQLLMTRLISPIYYYYVQAMHFAY